MRCRQIVKVSPVQITENLFFAIFGQKVTDDFAVSYKRKMQPNWTLYLYKVSFSLYMLVTVIVLINLLIAMMSDTYQSIVSQSDIEWKYGLSKLIRNMQKTKTAPSPLNLVSTWTSFLVKLCFKKAADKNQANGVDGAAGRTFLSKYPFFRAGRVLPLQRQNEGVNFSLLRSSPLGSQLSLMNTAKIDNVVEWEIVRRKYRMRFGDEVEKPSGDDPIDGA